MGCNLSKSEQVNSQPKAQLKTTQLPKVEVFDDYHIVNFVTKPSPVTAAQTPISKSAKQNLEKNNGFVPRKDSDSDEDSNEDSEEDSENEDQRPCTFVSLVDLENDLQNLSDQSMDKVTLPDCVEESLEDTPNLGDLNFDDVQLPQDINSSRQA